MKPGESVRSGFFGRLVFALVPAFTLATGDLDLRKAGFDPKKIEAMGEFAFREAGPHRTDSLLILTGEGKVLFERYARGYTPEMRHYGWSISKSVTMALFGIAESEGKISRTDPVSKWIPEFAGKKTIWDRVTLEHLITMSSGVAWNEGYGGDPLRSNVVAALYRTKPSFDFGLYRAKVDGEVAPAGKRFNYSSGDTTLLMRVLKTALGAEYADYPWKKLFGPLGMDSAVFERDGSGTFVGSSYVHATPRDFARFGLAFLRMSLNVGKGPASAQVVPAEWVKLAAKPSPALAELRLDHSPQQAYGYGWWLNRPLPQAQIGKRFAKLPDDAFLAQGHEGQYVAVVPSWNLVIARFGRDPDGKRIDFGELTRLLAEARTK